jgi:hypothetical protein
MRAVSESVDAIFAPRALYLERDCRVHSRSIWGGGGEPGPQVEEFEVASRSLPGRGAEHLAVDEVRAAAHAFRWECGI